MNKWISVEITPKTRSRLLVTNNINGRDAHGGMSHVWIGFLIESSDGEFVSFDEADSKIRGITHYSYIEPPEQP